MFTPMPLALARPRVSCTASRRALVCVCTRPITRHGDIEPPWARRTTRQGSIEYELVGTPRLSWQSSKSRTINALPDSFEGAPSSSEAAPAAASDSARHTSRVAAARAAEDLLQKAGEGDDVIAAVRVGILTMGLSSEEIGVMPSGSETQITATLRQFAGDVAGGARGTSRIQLPARPQGPVLRNLDAVAGHLIRSTRPGAGDCEFYVQQSTHKVLYIDPGCKIQEQLRAWLDLRVAAPFQTMPPVPLFINGLTKIGKTCTLSSVLPAVVRDHPQFGVGKDREVVVIQLNMDKYRSAGDLPAMTRAVYADLMAQVLDLRIPFSEQDWDILQCSVNTDLGTGILRLLSSLRVNVLILLDEVQAWMFPGGIKEVDLRNAMNARAFFKNLLYEAPDNILWAVTGSAMASFWLSAALAPKGGVALVMHNRKVDLPISADERVMHCTWMALCKELGLDRTKDELLFTLSGRSPALLVYSVVEWIAAGRPQSISEFMAKQVGEKVLVETFNDLSITLQLMEPKLRKILYLVSRLGHGVERPILNQQLGLLSWIESYLIPAAAGGNKVCLGSAHRQLFQSLIDPDGGLKRADVPATGSPTYWEARDFLFELCNSVVAAMKGEITPEHAKDLERLLQDWAKTVETRYGPASTWSEQDWFRRVLYSEYNAKDTARDFAAQLDALEPWQMLQWYHRLLRNCLGHKELEPEESVPLPKVVKVNGGRGRKYSLVKVKGGKGRSRKASWVKVQDGRGRKASLVVVSGGEMPEFLAEDVDFISEWPVASSVAEIATLICPIKVKWSPEESTNGSGGSESSSNSGGGGSFGPSSTVRLSAWRPSGAPLLNEVPIQWLARQGLLPVRFLDHTLYISMCGQPKHPK